MYSIMESDHCWVDLFESNYFSGKLRRVHGPRRLRRLQAKSLIVGPKATVMLSLKRGGRESIVKIDSRRVIPDLANSIDGATIRGVVVCTEENE